MAQLIVNLSGYLAAKPEKRYLPSGIPVTNISVANNWVKGSGDTKQEGVTWIRAAIWRDDAERVAEYLDKGSYIELTIDGLEMREFTRRDGSTGTSLEAIRVLAVKFGPRTGDAPASNGAPEAAAPAENPDIPF